MIIVYMQTISVCSIGYLNASKQEMKHLRVFVHAYNSTYTVRHSFFGVYSLDSITCCWSGMQLQVTFSSISISIIFHLSASYGNNWFGFLVWFGNNSSCGKNWSNPSQFQIHWTALHSKKIKLPSWQGCQVRLWVWLNRNRKNSYTMKSF